MQTPYAEFSKRVSGGVRERFKEAGSSLECLPQITEDRQIENLINNTQSNGLKSFLEGGNNRDFYEKADLNNMYNYYLNIRKFHPKTCRDLISYFKRFREQFFTERVEELRTLSPRIRSKINGCV